MFRLEGFADLQKAASGFQFTNAGTDWTINTSWASDGAELAMKKALRKGTYKDLNIYFQYAIGGNLGYCYFPTTAATGSNNFYVSKVSPPSNAGIWERARAIARGEH